MASPEESPELEALIVRRLVETANREKVIEELCLERGLHWQEAGQVVERVARAHNLEITRRQSPFLILTALSVFIGGLVLMAWNLLGIYNYFWPLFDPETPDALGLYLLASDVFQSALYFPPALPWFVTGLAMVAGSSLGLKEVWLSFFEWLDRRGLGQPMPAPAVQVAPNREIHAPEASGPGPKTEAAREYLLDHLGEGLNEIELVEALWLKFGINKPQGSRLVHQVLADRRKTLPGKASSGWILVSMAAFFVGLVWVSQFVFLLSAHLAGISRPLENAWHLILWISDISAYTQRFPVLFGLFALGLVLLTAGFYGLRRFWTFAFLLLRRSA